MCVAACINFCGLSVNRLISDLCGRLRKSFREMHRENRKIAVHDHLGTGFDLFQTVFNPESAIALLFPEVPTAIDIFGRFLKTKNMYR